MSRKLLWILLALLVLIGGGGAWYYFSDEDGASQAAAAPAPSGPGYTITPHDMTQGNPKAKVVLIEYAAPMCPHCAHFNEATFPKLKSQYIDTGKVFYVFRVLPIGPADGPAEKLARCQPKAKYFAFMDALFKNQPKWDPEYGVTDVRGGLLEIAKGFGMGEAEFDKCVSDEKGDTVINQVAEDGVNRYGINSTPSIVINGKLVPDLAEFGPLKAALDAALAK